MNSGPHCTFLTNVAEGKFPSFSNADSELRMIFSFFRCALTEFLAADSISISDSSADADTPPLISTSLSECSGVTLVLVLTGAVLTCLGVEAITAAILLIRWLRSYVDVLTLSMSEAFLRL